MFDDSYFKYIDECRVIASVKILAHKLNEIIETNDENVKKHHKNIFAHVDTILVNLKRRQDELEERIKIFEERINER
jgi:uncharacterized protein YaaN involved in tellurite resistance